MSRMVVAATVLVLIWFVFDGSPNLTMNENNDIQVNEIKSHIPDLMELESLSDSAEYPIPIIKLQQIITNELTKSELTSDDANLGSVDFNGELQLDEIRQRINSLRSIESK